MVTLSPDVTVAYNLSICTICKIHYAIWIWLGSRLLRLELCHGCGSN